MAQPTTPVEERTSGARTRTAGRAMLGILLLGAVLLGWFLPNRAVAPTMAGMPMTHYMQLLAVKQPWNLLMFMAAPVVLAETLAITELHILLRRDATPAWVHTLSRIAGLLAGPVMVAITVHLLRNAVVPLSTSGGWRGWADVVAVLSYMSGVIPMLGISLVEAGLLGHTATSARKLHVVFVAIFLVVAHVAMIAGMLDPAVTGWHDATAMTQQMDHSGMVGMSHDMGGMTMPMDTSTPMDHQMPMPSATPTR